MANSSREPGLSSAADADLRGRRILIAEDDYFIASELTVVCRDAGADVLGPYATGLEALDAVREHRPDLALLDVCLHDGDSFDAARKALEYRLAIVFLTGYDCETAVPDDLSTETCLEKPFGGEELLKAIHRGLAKSDRRD